jgi:hypothetical protein
MAKRRGPVPGFGNKKKSEDGALYGSGKKRKREKHKGGSRKNHGNTGGGGGSFNLNSHYSMGSKGFGGIPLPLDPGAAGELYLI